ncbi:MAG: LruC domain-containing protein [Bacteroidota bacterium]
MKTVTYILPILVLFLTQACVKDTLEVEEAAETDNNPTDPSEISLTDLVIPAGFDFSTQQNITVNIVDPQEGAVYDVYAFNEELEEGETFNFVNDEGNPDSGVEFQSDVLNNFIFRSMVVSGKITQMITLPSYYEKIYVRRKYQSKYSAEVVEIINGEAVYNFASLAGKWGKSRETAKAGVDDYLFCVNGSAELFQIDPLTGIYTAISDMPMGSYTCAIDQTNLLLYSIGRNSPYPLMKYDIVNDTWETVGDLPRGGPRLDYNSYDGLLYFSTRDKLYSIDPLNANVISTWDIEGLDSVNGGDLAFSEDGTLYLCTFSGLYVLEIDEEGVYQSDRISADNLPFSPTSMTFDSNNELWLANNGSSSDLIVMDTETGGWEYRYGVSANNGTDLGRTINDLTTFRVFTEDQEEVDTDGDGISDADDSFPDDADKAFETFTPSKYGWGTIAFEDLWPSLGDYDFNDIALNYKVVAIQNSSNEVVQVDFNINVKANGASLVNGFGIELENLVPSQVLEVTGTVYTQNYIVNNPNGTEADQENAVVIFYDNSFSMLNNPITVSIKFTTPITTEALGTAPFNPFIIINETRERELHLPYAHTTSLGNPTLAIDGINKDPVGNYVTETGLPWGINIVHDFKVPREKIPVNQAYNFFSIWATSGGISNQDWYKDSSGYRNESKLQLQ